MANDLLRGRQTLAALTNQSGGSVAAGDVVILDSANASSFTTTTTASLATRFVGVAVETIASAATGRVCLFGYVPIINLSSSATIGQYVATHTVAKQAAPTSTQGAGVFGQVLGTGTTPAAILFGYPQQAAASGGAVTQISSQTLGSAGTFSFSSFGTAATDLLLTWSGRSDQASDQNVYMRVNGDSGSNYDWQYVSGSSTSAGAAAGSAVAQWQVGAIPRSGVTAGAASSGQIVIPAYAATTLWKTFLSTTNYLSSPGSMVVESIAGAWRSTAAITSITLAPATGNFITGSTATLWKRT